MDILHKSRCTGGHFIIYPDKVTVELHALGTHKVNALMLKKITGIELKTTMARMFGMGGAATVIVHGTGDQKLEAKMVKLPEAQKAQEIINDLLSKKDAPANNNGLNDLEKLSDLKEKGIISEQEFEQKKKQLLGL